MIAEQFLLDNTDSGGNNSLWNLLWTRVLHSLKPNNASDSEMIGLCLFCYIENKIS